MELKCRKCGAPLTVPNGGPSPIIKCGNCGYPNPVITGGAGTPKPPAPANQEKPPTIERPQSVSVPPPMAATPVSNDLGWLIVHDENASSQTHPLRLGKQIVGRKSQSRPCDIMIDTEDVFMGRNHCIIEVKPNRSGSYEFFLSDVTMRNGVVEQMSTNGTFVNAYPTALKPKDMVYLKDGDTIQMGQTKVVLKTLISSASASDASRMVQDTEYMPTVIIR